MYRQAIAKSVILLAILVMVFSCANGGTNPPTTLDRVADADAIVFPTFTDPLGTKAIARTASPGAYEDPAESYQYVEAINNQFTILLANSFLECIQDAAAQGKTFSSPTTAEMDFHTDGSMGNPLADWHYEHTIKLVEDTTRVRFIGYTNQYVDTGGDPGYEMILLDIPFELSFSSDFSEVLISADVYSSTDLDPDVVNYSVTGFDYETRSGSIIFSSSENDENDGEPYEGDIDYAMEQCLLNDKGSVTFICVDDSVGPDYDNAFMYSNGDGIIHYIEDNTKGQTPTTYMDSDGNVVEKSSLDSSCSADLDDILTNFLSSTPQAQNLFDSLPVPGFDEQEFADLLDNHQSNYP